MDIAMKILAGSYLLVMAVIDKRKKSIPVAPGLVLTLLCVALKWVEGEFFLPGLVVGLTLYLVSKVSGGGIGEGDALAYLPAGVVLGFFHTLEMLIISLFLAAAAGIFLMVTRHVGKKHTLPFIPFTALGYCLVML